MPLIDALDPVLVFNIRESFFWVDNAIAMPYERNNTYIIIKISTALDYYRVGYSSFTASSNGEIILPRLCYCFATNLTEFIKPNKPITISFSCYPKNNGYLSYQEIWLEDYKNIINDYSYSVFNNKFYKFNLIPHNNTL